MRLLTSVILLMAAPAANAEEGFLEGFPDVPLLPVIRAIDGDPVIFDTPSGTVAEATLLVNGTPAKAMETYRESLSALGWACNAPAIAMTCTRDENRLTFTSPAPKEEGGRLVLKVAPQN